MKATFFASYVHTTVIFVMLWVFTFSVYASAGDGSGLFGSPDNVYNGMEKASLHAFFGSTNTWGTKEQFSAINSYIANDGKCFTTADRTETDKTCRFAKRALDDYCCEKDAFESAVTPDTYCRATKGDCIDVSDVEHYESSGCDDGEYCVPSFLTMGSPSGLLFGITNIVGNFGTVFVDQSYWQSAVAAKPKSAVLGFLIGGMVWFAVPFCMATTNGLVGRALTTHPELGSLYITAAASGSGLTPARVLAHILGAGGAFILLLQLFMAITSTGSAEIIVVSSILTYDVYYEYINPELKSRREGLKAIFFKVVAGFEKEGTASVQPSQIPALLQALVSNKFFEKAVPPEEATQLSYAVQTYVVDGSIPTSDLYNLVNKNMASNSIEGIILLRVSKFFTAVFAIFMGFLAVFLQTLGFSLGWVYMSMGVIIGSAVGPASLTILMETANGFFIGAGAIGGLVLGVLGWTIKAAVDNGAVTYDTLGQDWPWVVGNLCAIFGGLLIAGVGSLIFPDKNFKWHMLNERIPLVDDVEPPKDKDESEEKLQVQVKVAVAASVILTIVLLVLWPLPMHASTGVFGKAGFSVWVTLEMIWSLVGGIVIIGLPVYETFMSFKQAKAMLAQADAVNKAPNSILGVEDTATPVAEKPADEQVTNEPAKP